MSHPERQVSTRQLVRVRRGILAPADAWRDLKPWERYVARVHAVTMTHPGITLSHESAAAIRGLPVFGEPAEIHALDVPGSTSKLNGGIRLHTTVEDREVHDIGGAFLTSVSNTVVDLARSRHGAVSLAVADAALRADPDLSVETLIADSESRASSRGRRIARWALHRATPFAETALESVSRAAIEWLGFEEPELQKVFVTRGVVDRSDMWWESVRVIAEADGDIKYDGSLQPSVTAIRNEKDRDRRLSRHAARIAHFGWTDVVRLDPLRDELHRAGVRRVTGESSRDLLTLGKTLRPRRPPHRETAT